MKSIFRKHYSNFHDMKTKTYKNWTLDHGYVESAGPFAYPRRALLAGASNALSITLSATKKDLDPTCKDSMQGFRVKFPNFLLSSNFTEFFLRLFFIPLAVFQDQVKNISEFHTIKL